VLHVAQEVLGLATLKGNWLTQADSLCLDLGGIENHLDAKDIVTLSQRSEASRTFPGRMSGSQTSAGRGSVVKNRHFSGR
jgi:hypothetical protein